MSSRVLRLGLMAVCAIVLAFAEVPSDRFTAPVREQIARRRHIGSISAGEYARINGALIRAKGVPRWPVFRGDVIDAIGAPVRISFADGSRIRLDEGSSASVSGDASLIAVVIREGSAGYILAGRTSVTTPRMPNPLRSGSGTLTSTGRIGPLAARPSWAAWGWCGEEWLIHKPGGRSYLNPSCEPCLDEPVPGESVAVCSRP